jgi:2-oxoisovalerate dehydrogenase E2 component (dihydrolipoyl transacylase)
VGIHVIKMPDLGEGIAEVEVVEWRVQPGDAVGEDQVLADVMTDKATVEIPSPVKGTVLALGGAVGQALAVGAELIRIEVADAGNHVPAPVPAPELREVPAPQQAKPAPMAAAKPAPQAETKLALAPAAPAPNGHGEKPLASPSVRQRARALGVDLHHVTGTGPARHITHADLDALLARGRGGAAGGGYHQLQGEQAVPSSACAARSPKKCRTPNAGFRILRMSRKWTSPKSKPCACS